jgi:hypothetical protein
MKLNVSCSMFLATRISLIFTMALFSVPMVYWIWRGLPWFFNAAVVAAFVLHVVAYRSLVSGKAWGWWLWLLGPLVCLAMAGPNVVYNTYLFAIDDPLYLDSPATILVVAVTAIFLVVPQCVSLCFLVVCRARKCFPWQATNYSFESDAAEPRTSS